MRHAIIVFIILVVVGALIFSYIEGWEFSDSLYFTVVSLTTVGYGDITPQTKEGKLFTIIFLMVGIGLALYILTSFTSSVLQTFQTTERLIEKLRRKETELLRREKELEKIEKRLEKRMSWLERKLKNKR